MSSADYSPYEQKAKQNRKIDLEPIFRKIQKITHNIHNYSIGINFQLHFISHTIYEPEWEITHSKAVAQLSIRIRIEL